MSPEGVMPFSGMDAARAKAWIILQITHPIIAGPEMKYNFLSGHPTSLKSRISTARVE
jgi:hypothetical protein